MAATAFLSATAIDLRTVRVLFGNGGVPDTLPLPDVSGEVFDQAAWSIVPTAGKPAVTPTVTSVLDYRSTAPFGFDDGVDLILDTEITPDATYSVSNTGAALDFPVSQTVAFVASGLLGFPADRDFSLLDFVPRINVSDDTSGDMTNFMKVLQEPLNLLLRDIDHWIDIFDCDLAPEAFLDLILADLGNQFHFNTELDEKQKRRLVRTLVDIYKLKGTLKGVQEAISLFMGMRSEFVEFNGLGNELDAGFKLDDATHVASPPFHLGGGGPWQLLIKVGTTVVSQTDAGASLPYAGGPLTADQIDQVLQILAVMKPAHLILVPTADGYVRWGVTLSKRNAIQRVNGTQARLFMEPVSGADYYDFLESLTRDLQEFGSAKTDRIDAATCLVGDLITHGGTIKYWNGVAYAKNPVNDSRLRIDFDSSLGVSVAGPLVTAWANQGLDGGTATQGTGAKRPAIIANALNGAPGIQFDGINDILNLSINPNYTTSTMFMVLSSVGANVTADSTMFATQKLAIKATGSLAANRWSSYANVNIDSGTVLTNAGHVLAVVIRTADDIDMVTDGSLVTRTNGTGFPARIGSSIGGDPTDTLFSAFIVQRILVYNAALSATEREAVQQYLGARYGILLNGLPARATAGLLGNEITNELSTASATVLTVTPQSRNLRLNWTSVTGATRYRIYRSVGAMVSPVNADNADTPIEVFADQTSYNDPQETGVLRHYIVAPVKKDSEGFFSNDASGTAI